MPGNRQTRLLFVLPFPAPVDNQTWLDWWSPQWAMPSREVLSLPDPENRSSNVWQSHLPPVSSHHNILLVVLTEMRVVQFDVFLATGRHHWRTDHLPTGVPMPFAYKDFYAGSCHCFLPGHVRWYQGCSRHTYVYSSPDHQRILLHRPTRARWKAGPCVTSTAILKALDNPSGVLAAPVLFRYDVSSHRL